jgi:starvation-inducible outer membrane lipoprotein
MEYEMKKSMILVGLLCLTMAACSSIHHGEVEKEGAEVKVPFDQLPASVKATIQREAEGVSIATVDKETEDGKVTYEADAVISGTPYEIRVAEDGKLISKAIDEEAKESAATPKSKD